MKKAEAEAVVRAMKTLLPGKKVVLVGNFPSQMGVFQREVFHDATICTGTDESSYSVSVSFSMATTSVNAGFWRIEPADRCIYADAVSEAGEHFRWAWVVVYNRRQDESSFKAFRAAQQELLAAGQST